MTRVFTLVLTAALTAGLVGCGDGQKTEISTVTTNMSIKPDIGGKGGKDGNVKVQKAE